MRGRSAEPLSLAPNPKPKPNPNPNPNPNPDPNPNRREGAVESMAARALMARCVRRMLHLDLALGLQAWAAP